ncbi:MAG: Transcriptional regulator (precursor) [Candidatus Tokpelaia hoelldobleri]|uniref:Transcriptional regulator (Precursor) n=1 Tax=Candidatus Tokpelaia hoelldobleri TaxID=1902579 RepID=A0A1U9JSP1_9HYPH|nr:MAG: Transcriptional regulator (precursor) [Candidatus Tokpelaia hoelldoblerii]
MRSDLNAIPVFLAVAETGNFTAAAQKLHLTRSAVSKTIARLEAQLGVVLFLRTTRSQSLSDEGAVFYEHCRQAMAQINTAETLLDSGKLQAQGRLRISVPVLFGQHCIAPLLTDFVLAQPQLMLDMAFSDRVMDLVEEGFDLAIRVGTLPDSSSLTARKLGVHRMLLCASPAYLARAGQPETIAALEEHATLAYRQAGLVQKWSLDEAQGQPVFFRPQEKIVMDDFQALANAALAGQGISWLPHYLIGEKLNNGELVEILPQANTMQFPVHAIWPHTTHVPLKTRLAVDLLAKALPARLQ